MSSIIIGAGTTVGGDFDDYCVTSVNWGYSPNPQRLYCIGSWTPYQTLERPVETVNLTIYAPGPSYLITPSQACEDVTNEVSITISPAGCGDNVPGAITGGWGITSYSYSKDDPQGPGQESWSFTRWVDSQTTPVVPAPDYVIRGISEGSASDPIINTGIVFDGDTSQGSTGSVSAGAVGRADLMYYGVVSQIGGGTSAAGELGTGSASVPLTPLWI